MKNKLPEAIEAILFVSAEPMTFATLAKILSVDIEQVEIAVEDLSSRLENHGIKIASLNQVVSLVTDSEFSEVIEKIKKEELTKELSKSSAETLAIVIYRPGISKSQIEFIRGVNASYSLRALQMRGLIEQKSDGRMNVYFPTISLLEHFGITTLEELPEFNETKQKIDKLFLTEEKI